MVPILSFAPSLERSKEPKMTGRQDKREIFWRCLKYNYFFFCVGFMKTKKAYQEQVISDNYTRGVNCRTRKCCTYGRLSPRGYKSAGFPELVEFGQPEDVSPGKQNYVQLLHGQKCFESCVPAAETGRRWDHNYSR